MNLGASIIALITTFVVVLALDLAGKRRYMKHCTVAGMIIALLALFFFTPTTFSVFRLDTFTLFFSLIFILVGLLVVLTSHESTFIYHGSIILSTLGMIFAASAGDVVLLYIGIELVTAPTYVLVAYHKTPQRMEAAVKYFVVSIVASALMLLGLVIMASLNGTTTMADMVLGANPLMLLGIAAFIAGIGFKLGIFPFNFWIPDVYQGAPPEIAGLLAGSSKKAAYAGFLRIAVVIAALHNWQTIFIVLAALTMTIPNIIALLQTNVRRLLSYSIMSHAGFLLLGIAAATSFGYAALLFHAFTHAFMALGAFIVLGVFMSHHIEDLEQLKGLGWRNPLLGASLTVFLLSLAGIPLLSGFASKFYLFYAAADAGLLWLVALAILNSVLALYYYFRIIRALYAYPAGGHAFKLRPGTLVAVLLCLLLTIIAGVWPQPFIEFANAAVKALF